MKLFEVGRTRTVGDVSDAVATTAGADVPRRRVLLRSAALAVLGTAPVLVLSAPAYAAGNVAKVGNQIVVNADNNRASNVAVNQIGVNFFISDTVGTLSAGPGCVGVNTHLVRCSTAGVVRVVVNAGNLDDRVANNTSTASTLNGGLGNDTLIGGSGNDRLVGGFGDDTLSGRAGRDTAVALFLRDGRDRFSGGAGVDTTDYSARTIAVNVSLNGVANDGSAPEFDNNLTDVENAVGGSRNDVLTGNASANTLQGRAGNDTLSGLAGNDVLIGGAGNDRLIGGFGNDRLFGNAGNDTAVALVVRDGQDVFSGGAGVDTTDYSARTIAVNVSLNGVANDGSFPEFDNNLTDVENAVGGSRNDVISGNASANALQGRAGNDTLSGLAGNDTLIGGAGNDRMFGGAGDDRLFGVDGVRGNDLLNGGVNVDRCVADLLDVKISCEL